jgi:DNA invertase Pin-like site-specific DNA recombinase
MSKVVKAGSPSVAVAYIRVSKDEQKLGPEAQRASIEAWAAREGVQVVAWHVDQGVCSVTPVAERPALVAALAALRHNGAGVLVVAKRDRIARDIVLASTVGRAAQSNGAALVSAMGEGNGDTPADAMMRGVVDVFAAYERDMIRARTKAALDVIRARGHKTGGSVPFGFTLASDGRTLVEVAAEQAIISRAKAHRAAGLSFGKVAVALASEGLVSRAGKPLVAMQVARMLAA